MTYAKTIILCALLFSANLLTAQVKRVQENKKETQSGEMSVRARSFIDGSAPSSDDAKWSRVIYRELDLMEGSNASLYFPEEPIEGHTNLFRLIVNLMADGNLTGYEYLDGREIFTEKYELNVKDMLNKFHILYEEKPGRGRTATQFVIDESDVPCNEVRSYYIKEKWIFDQRGSKFFATIEAICPILHRSGDFGGEVTKYPMFWLPYEKIRPYLTQHRVMSEGMNNTPRYTFDDFFVMRQYDGKIYKTLNLHNRSLMQMHPHPDSLKMAQEKIEQDLVDFRQSLWVPEAQEAQAAAKKTSGKSEAKADAPTTAINEPEETVVEKPARTSVRQNPRQKSSTSRSSQKSSSRSEGAPVRSVRRTR
ncbi:MAG: gliding motility protein GldN [Bacteroidales bacterium]